MAGSAGDMPKGVAAALDEIARKRGWGDGGAESEGYSAYLERTGRMQYETWS